MREQDIDTTGLPTIYRAQNTHDLIVPVNDLGLELGIGERSLNLLSLEIPTGELYDEIESRGGDPNFWARYFIGEGYNPLSRKVRGIGGNPLDFYVPLEAGQPKVELGFLRYPKTDEEIDVNEVVHMHPACSEELIVTRGSLRLIAEIGDVLKVSGGQHQIIGGREIAVNFEDPSPEVVKYWSKSGNLGAVGYVIRMGTYHLLNYVESGTNLILLKRGLDEPGWGRRQLHPSESS